MVTIKDIAKEAGYSISTVSRVMNNKEDVSEKAKVEINKVIKKYNFEINTNAKNLAQKKSKVMLVIVKGTMNMLFAKILEKLQECFSEENLELNIHYLDENDNEVLCAKKLNNELQPKGICFLGGTLDNFEKDFNTIKIPCILIAIDATNLNIENLSSISIEDFSSAKLVADHFNKNELNKVGLICGGTQNIGPAKLRYEGFVERLKELDINFNHDKQFIEARYSLESGYNACIELIEKFPEMNALFCASDVMAIGAIRAIYDLNKRIPEDISVIGFDGIELSQYSTPRLTTIYQDPFELAIEGSKMILNQINKNGKSEHKQLKAYLINGKTVLRKD